MKFFKLFGEYILLMKGMFTKPENFKMYWKELMHQCVEIGIGALGIVSIISIFMGDRKSTRLNSSHERLSRMPSSA